MMKVFLLVAALAACLLGAGCDSRTPEEQEAAKYPQVKPLTAEEKKKLDEQLASAHQPPPAGAPPRQEKDEK